MRKLLICLLFLMSVGFANEGISFQTEISAKAKEYGTVVFSADIHCENCVKKVIENISYVKGVKDLQVSLEKREIMVKYDPQKTSAEKIQSELRKLGYAAKIKENKQF